jgi:tetratricopeptide (TPR) repeat protein
LAATLSPKELESINEVPTRNTRAYEFYLSAREYHRDPNRRTNLRIAIQQYHRAVEEDPTFAVALARLSQAHSEMYFLAFDRSASRLELSLAAVNNAFSVRPGLPEAHLAMADYYFTGFRDYEKALRELDIAEDALPGEPDLYELRAAIFRRSGQWETALGDIARFIELDPRDAQALRDRVATTYLAMRDYSRADSILEQVVEFVPDDGRAHSLRAQIPLKKDGDTAPLKTLTEDLSIAIPHRQQRRWMTAIYERDLDAALRALNDWDVVVFNVQDDYRPRSLFYGTTYKMFGKARLAEPHFQAARAQLEMGLETSPEDERFHISLAEVFAGLEENKSAIEAAETAMALMPPDRDSISGRVVQLHAIMRVFSVIGDHDRVITELEDYLASPGGEWSIEGLLPDPRFDAIREDPRFLALVEKHRQ